jgi:para-aminobenzoate synthetase component 1
VADLLHAEPGFAWLDGGGTRHVLLHRPLAGVSCDGQTASVTGPDGTVRLDARAIDVLDAMIEAWRGPADALLVGFLSYDVAGEIEELGEQPPADFSFPTMHFGLYDSALVWEEGFWNLHATGGWKEPESAETLLQNAAALSAVSRPVSAGALSSRPAQGCFEAAVGSIVRRIHNGDFFQTNLCRRLEASLDPADAWELYRRMRGISPARYGAFLNLGGGQSLLSVSPELFLKVDAARGVESRPIKGTRPRGGSEEEDRALACELLDSEKDRAELAMIVDVVRNDLSRVCETGSVIVARHGELESLPTVHHTVSTVRGRLREGTGIGTLLRAAFPAASITGAPKIEAMRAAMAEEGQRRGPCMGSIGWISMDGRMELSVAIRTAFVTSGRVRYYAGGGITADSDPAGEFEETAHKASAFLRALGISCDSWPNT